MTLRERKKINKLHSIERAGRRLFAEHGYEATTTRAIAEEAGIGVGTLFVYFPEKLDLLVHLYRLEIERATRDAWDSLIADLPLVDALVHLFDPLFRLYDRDRELARVFVKELMFLDLERQREMFQLTVKFLAEIGELVEVAKARREVRTDVPTPLAAHQIFGLYYWTLVNWLTGVIDSRAHATEHLRLELELALRGFASTCPCHSPSEPEPEESPQVLAPRQSGGDTASG